MRVLRGVVYMTNSKGSRTQPCRTQLGDVCQEDRSVPHDTEATSRAAERSSRQRRDIFCDPIALMR